MQEHKRSISAYFITLTYDSNHVAISKRGFMDLRKRDLQLFFKRLRKLHGKRNGGNRIKYFAVGEYGSTYKRPHYHIILFNADIKLLQLAWRREYKISTMLPLKRRNRFGVKFKLRVEKKYKDIGQIYYGTVTEASVGYCLKYITKPSKVPYHKNDDRQKEFSIMSKGLGAGYLTDNMRRWHLEDVTERMYVNVGDGKKATMPRYYKDRLYNDHHRSWISIVHIEKLADKASAGKLTYVSHEKRRNQIIADYRRMYFKQLNF